MSTRETKIELYTSGTPNGQKASCVLEELGLSYTVHKIDLAKDEQKQDWYLKINPNGRIPALVDDTPETGNGRRIFESGALMLYLCEKYDKDHRISFPYDSDEYWECMSWHIWMQSGLGPMQGQANHFYRYAPEKIEYGINRYQTETKRLFGVLEDRLKEQDMRGLGLWIVGGKYTFVDLNVFCWVNWAEWARIGLDAFPNLKKWLGVIQERGAVKRGVDVPDKFEMKEAMKTKEGEQEYARHHSNWVMQGQKDAQEKHK
jgi:glutathione S-transferase